MDDKGNFYVYHEIDGSTEKMTAKQIADENYSNIGKAMKEKALSVAD